MTPARLLLLCLFLVLGGVALWVFGPTPVERLAVLIEERRWPEAEALARSALEDSSGEVRADLYRDLGFALARQERHTEAIEAFQEAFALRPDDPEMRRRAAISMVGVGRQHDARGDSDAAVARYREAVALAPDIPHGHRALVPSLRERGERDEAIAALQVGLRHGPGDVHLRLQLAWLLATHPDPARRDVDRAVDLASDAFLHDRTPETLETMAVALAAKGNFRDAVEHQRSAIELAGGEEAPEFEARQARLEAFEAKRPYLEGVAAGGQGSKRSDTEVSGASRG
ncbi:MAG: tetratricopeptide repeat protein [Myxococcota bacterium]